MAVPYVGAPILAVDPVLDICANITGYSDASSVKRSPLHSGDKVVAAPYVGATILAVDPERDIYANITGYSGASSVEYVLSSVVGTRSR